MYYHVIYAEIFFSTKMKMIFAKMKMIFAKRCASQFLFSKWPWTSTIIDVLFIYLASRKKRQI